MRNRARILAAFVVLSVVLFATNGFSTHGQFYVLDGFGGVHAGNGAPVISPATPYFGFDVASDMTYIPVGSSSGSAGDGILVLDDFGGVHEGGAIAGEGVAGGTPYFGFDIARAIVYRNIPPRINSAIMSGGNVSVTSSTYVSQISTTLRAPDDGSVLVACSTSFGNNSGANVGVRTAIGVDSLVAAGAIEKEIVILAGAWNSQAVVQTVAVSAGLHTFHCLNKKQSGVADPAYFDPTISAIFIDLGPTGISAPETGYVGPDGAIGQ